MSGSTSSRVRAPFGVKLRVRVLACAIKVRSVKLLSGGAAAVSLNFTPRTRRRSTLYRRADTEIASPSDVSAPLAPDSMGQNAALDSAPVAPKGG